MKIKLMLILLILILLPVISLAETNKIYFLDLKYDHGDINLKNVKVKKGFVPDRKNQPEEGYKAEVISFSGKLLDSFKFNVPRIIFSPPPRNESEASGPIILDEVDFSLLIPYFRTGKAINIYDPNNTLRLSIDISQFAVCNENNQCEPPKENYRTCPQDCPSGSRDNYCDRVKDGKCDPDCTKREDIDCGISFIQLIAIILGLIPLLILFIFILYLRLKR